MPLFDIRCPQCKRVREDVIALSKTDATRFRCEQCGASPQRVLPSAGAIQVKGFSARNGYASPQPRKKR